MTNFSDNLNILLDFYYELNEVRFKLGDNIRTPHAWDNVAGNFVPLFEETPQIPLESEIVEMRNKVLNFFISTKRFFWREGDRVVQDGLNPNLSYDRVSPFLLGIVPT